MVCFLFVHHEKSFQENQIDDPVSEAFGQLHRLRTEVNQLRTEVNRLCIRVIALQIGQGIDKYAYPGQSDAAVNDGF